MWGAAGPREGEGGGAERTAFSLMAAPSAIRLTEQFFSPQKPGASQGSGAIPAEFLTPPPQTFGAQLFGGGPVTSSTLNLLDIKPEILAPTPPLQSSNETQSDDNEIEILMDDMLKDLESNPNGFSSKESGQSDDSSIPTQRSLGLSIRKDIFATPKKGQPDVVDLGDSPPTSTMQSREPPGQQHNYSLPTASSGVQHQDGGFLASSKQASAALLSASAAQIFQQSLGAEGGPSGHTWTLQQTQASGHLHPFGSKGQLGESVRPGWHQARLAPRPQLVAPGLEPVRTIRTIAPKPLMAIAPKPPQLSLGPASAGLGHGFPTPTSISQSDMMVAAMQLKQLDALQARAQQAQQDAAGRGRYGKGQLDLEVLQARAQQDAAVRYGNGYVTSTEVPTGFNTNVAEFLFRPEVANARQPKPYNPTHNTQNLQSYLQCQEKPKTYNRYGSQGGKNAGRQPLFVDPTLPPGWSRKVSQRVTGATAGGWDTYITDPTGKRFRSKQDIRRQFEMVGETYLNWQDFDFNPFGSKGQLVEDDQNVPFWEEEGGDVVDVADFLKAEMIE